MFPNSHVSKRYSVLFTYLIFQDEEQLPLAAEALGLADAPASPDSEAAAGGAPSLLPLAPHQSLFRTHLCRLLSMWYKTFPPSAPTA